MKGTQQIAAILLTFNVLQGAFNKTMTDVTKLKKDLAEKDQEFRNAKKAAQQHQKDNEKLLAEVLN